MPVAHNDEADCIIYFSIDSYTNFSSAN